jgi:hypothetical protein
MFAFLYFVATLVTSPVLAAEPVAPAAPAAPVEAAPAAPVEGAAPAAAPVEGAAPVAEEKKEEVVVPATDAEAVATASEAVDAFVVGQYTFGALLLCAVLIFVVKRFASKKKAE